MTASAESQFPASVQLAADVVQCAGVWRVIHLRQLALSLQQLDWPDGAIVFDGSAITELDTSGALLLLQTATALEQQGHQVHFRSWQQAHFELLRLVRQRRVSMGEKTAPAAPLNWLARLGKTSLEHARNGLEFLAFTGEITLVLLRVLLQPARLRWRALFAIIEAAGVNALPILALLSFLMGVVIAYQGGLQLKSYGANIFIVELVTLTMLRELAPLVTAIIVAGRTGSAFTAEIGTMQVTEEIDALRTIGIAPIEILVLPKLLGLVLALPLLTLFADAASVLGGMVMAYFLLDVSFRDFALRIPEAVSVTSLLIGVGKAPVFAALIALVGCYQGFHVSGGADSVSCTSGGTRAMCAWTSSSASVDTNGARPARSQ